MREIERVAEEDVVIEGEVLPDERGIWDFLKHPNVITVHWWGEPEESARAHYVMDDQVDSILYAHEAASIFVRNMNGRDEVFFNGSWHPAGYVHDE